MSQSTHRPLHQRKAPKIKAIIVIINKKDRGLGSRNIKQSSPPVKRSNQKAIIYFHNTITAAVSSLETR